jgi:hypothetical protein
MKYYKLSTIIEAEDDWSEERIIEELDLQFNTGAGAHMDLDEELKIKEIKKNYE